MHGIVIAIIIPAACIRAASYIPRYLIYSVATAS